jgi:hypothetical protein
MSEKLKEEIKADAAKVHAAFDRLEEEVEEVLKNLTFRFKRFLHVSSHEEVDGQIAAGREALTNALAAGRAAAASDAPGEPVAAEPAPAPAAPEATDAKTAQGEESATDSDAKDAPGSDETKEGE